MKDTNVDEGFLEGTLLTSPGIDRQTTRRLCNPRLPTYMIKGHSELKRSRPPEMNLPRAISDFLGNSDAVPKARRGTETGDAKGCRGIQDRCHVSFFFCPPPQWGDWI